MALPYKPQRTFTGTVGVASTGANGPEAIKTDTNEIVAMFDPLASHGDGTGGGIAKGNLATGSGILTEDDDVILEDINGDLFVTRDVNAGRDLNATRNVTAGGNVNATGQMTATQFNGLLNGSSSSCSGTAANASQLDSKSAGNASGNIPVSNGTKCTDLNADTVDGYHAGNASGKIAVNNGTICTNLNAEQCGGLTFLSIKTGTVAISGSGTATVTQLDNSQRKVFVAFKTSANSSRVSYSIGVSIAGVAPDQSFTTVIQFLESAGVGCTISYTIITVA